MGYVITPELTNRILGGFSVGSHGFSWVLMGIPIVPMERPPSTLGY